MTQCPEEARALRGLAGFPKMLSDEGTQHICEEVQCGILGDKSQAGQNAQIIGSRSQDIQSVPAGGVQVLRALESIGGSLGEFYANKVQVYRQRVTHLETNERVGSKDEKEQRREWKAEFSALIVAAAALPRLSQTRQKMGLLLLNPVTN